MNRLALATALVLAFPAPAASQGVLVAPHQIFMDHRSRSGVVELYNPGSESTEISISTFFGYPATDSTGQYELRTVDDPDSTQPSAAAWITAFPRRLMLAPQQRQTVRLLGRPPAGLPDGEYWARLTVSAKGGQVPVTTVGDTTGIEVGLTLEVRTVLPINYRKGATSTGLTLWNLRAQRITDSLEVRGILVRTGNAAFLGTVRGVLEDSTGHTVSKFESPVAVYYSVDPRFIMPINALAPGRYWLRVEVVSERQDIPPEAIDQTAPLRDSIEVSLP
jgi:P pilus assembly chaperone PapD